MSSPTPRRPTRTLAFLPLAVAAFSAVLASQMIGRDPRAALPLLGFAVLLLAPALVGRMRMRKLLMSGDAERVIAAWEGWFVRAAHAETVGPLLRATAYAACGLPEAARRSLSRAVKGPAWEAAIEQRLFVETLLDTFEGERDAALQKAEALQALPMPAAGLLARRRIALLRRALGALARAFAHASREGDTALLARAGAASPLVHWAMRYAAAIVAVDGGRARDVPSLLTGAPQWPQGSAFHVYHEELLAHARAGG